MKTSTILIISVIIIFLISLTAYNITLRASYLNGDYKNPFYGLKCTPLNPVKDLKIESSNSFQIRVIKGEKNAIYFSERADGHYIYRLDKELLSIDLSPESKKKNFTIYSDDIIVVLSKLESLTLKPDYSSKDGNTNNLSGRIDINGFNQDAMYLNLGTGSIVSLDSLGIEKLTALVGTAGDKPAELSLKAGKYQSARFEILGKGMLELLDADIVRTEYHLSNSASVKLNGQALKDIK